MAKEREERRENAKRSRKRRGKLPQPYTYKERGFQYTYPAWYLR
jgi:hypothetical protein